MGHSLAEDWRTGRFGMMRSGGRNHYPGASVALDFTRNRYRVGAGTGYTSLFSAMPNLTVTRASVGYAERSDGTLVLFGTNTARITDKGLLVEEARTNKSTNTNVNPANTTNVTKGGDAASVLSVVDDTAALASIGLSGNVFKLDNSLGVAVATAIVAGTAGNTNAHTASLYWRGSGTARYGNTGTFGVNEALPASYTRVSKTQTPDIASRSFGVEVSAGGVAYFILNQFEEGSFVTSPIPVAGASATRAADVVSIGGLSVSTSTVLATGTPQGLNASGTNYYAALSDGTGDNLAYLFAVSATTGAGVTVATVGQTSSTRTVAFSGGTRWKVAGKYAANTVQFAGNGTLGTAPANTFTIPTFTQLNLGGRADAARAISGYLERVIVYPRAFSDAELTAATV